MSDTLTAQDVIERSQEVIERCLPHDEPRRVLDAGCGHHGYVTFGAQAHVVGIDISETSLANANHVHEKIVADLLTYPLEHSSFDAIVCWDVLEHLPTPEKALEKFADAVVSGGVIVLGMPNIWSLKGIVTKLTPHALHVWAYRHLLGSDNAGTEGNGPFRTFMRRSMSIPAVRRFAVKTGLKVEYLGLYETPMLASLLTTRRAQLLWNVVGRCVQVLTFNRIDAKQSDLVIILKKGTESVAVPQEYTPIVT
jgi:2-polyprenyl-3-methyl-5-hydroxy-6-metoxy-1,4-benzoquinol methylase